MGGEYNEDEQAYTTRKGGFAKEFYFALLEGRLGAQTFPPLCGKHVLMHCFTEILNLTMYVAELCATDRNFFFCRHKCENVFCLGQSFK